MWPHEIKTAFGISGTALDMWMEVIALRKLAEDSDEIVADLYFEESEEHENLPVLDASALEPGARYIVVMRDGREDSVHELTPEQLARIQASFQQYDKDGSGFIDQEEVNEMVRERTARQKSAIMAQYEAYISNNPSDRDYASSVVQSALYRIEEAGKKMLEMFVKIDIDGSGTICYREFLLAEAFWLQSSINSSGQSLF